MPNGIYELPPVLSGTEAQKIDTLRAFLVRLINDLGQTEITTESTAAGKIEVKNGKKTLVTGANAVSAGIAEATALRDLIIKTANEAGVKISDGDTYVMSYADTQINNLSQSYVAKSEYGEFVENINTTITTTAKDTVESYGYDSKISAAENNIMELQEYVNSIDGQIRRGIVLDPTTNQYVTGIAISQNLQFTGQEVTKDDGHTYYYLNSGQTFGLYTSTGWQFWIDGMKRGWYDSEDGMLHVSNEAIENTLQIGAEWQWINSSGLGLKYVGN